jgi:hypothetical protein
MKNFGQLQERKCCGHSLSMCETVAKVHHLSRRLEDKIFAWDMEIIKQHAVEENVFTTSEVGKAEREYKRYMLLSFSGTPIPISVEVDKMWHEHILSTENYALFCRKTGGHFIHHRPGILDRNVPREVLTFDSYRAMWGEPDPRWWKSATLGRDGKWPCRGDGKCH